MQIVSSSDSFDAYGMVWNTSVMKDGVYVFAVVAPPTGQCTIKETNRKTCLLDLRDYSVNDDADSGDGIAGLTTWLLK